MKRSVAHRIKLTSLSLISFLCMACQEEEETLVPVIEELPDEVYPEESEPENSYNLPDIDLSHWKVTLPVGNPTEVYPPEILDYANNEILRPFMYNDSVDGSLVFYTYPDASTANSTYSRSELRELMEPNDLSRNWSFNEGGKMKGTLAIDDISKDKDGKYHRTIVMQIHGRLSNEQKDLISAKDNNAPPILKIYWHKGYVRVKSKYLKDKGATDVELLSTDAWGDDDGFNFDSYVGFEPFDLEIIASAGKMEILLNQEEYYVIENNDLVRWGVFENYFKAGNYLSTKDEGAYAKVKYYSLEVTH
ncbi:polysaccharide lyase family 7 protein [Lutimonas zeaxanthinifaciens]|uniref:polysaccharide lyase family 7 protein n=1 Tax=Lutimonas zeaxanthinifaciens TaxID=3060215 RepID=UPI00265D34A4|nr:polysaccharide lyase family 7 protein [Lutimonas sp. YSD2104]WKK66447.1 polysaccharide lyase family 7 protein [Lutimonas sp. YSD2104]